MAKKSQASAVVQSANSCGFLIADAFFPTGQKVCQNQSVYNVRQIERIDLSDFTN